MEKVSELLESSVLIQATMALSLLGVIIYLVVNAMAIPEIVTNGFLLILGFYFGSKTAVEARKVARYFKKEE